MTLYMSAPTRATTVPVLLPLPLPGPYDYLGEGLAPGDIVEAPLGRRLVPGVVWDGGPGGVEADRLKPVARRFDAPAMRRTLRRFVARVANYTLSPPGSVLRMALSVPAALEPPRPRRAWRLADAPPPAIRATPQRLAVLELLAGGGALTAAEVARGTGTGTGVLKGLAALGAVEPVALAPGPVFLPPDPDGGRVSLTGEQAAAASELGGTGFGVSLLEGVAGAGKTEVYFEAVAAALRRGRQALILLPEIALTAQWMRRFEARFGARPLAWHSDLPSGERRAGWRAVAEGEARVVVGARSALFLPFPALGVVVVDEEHEPAFKQEDGVAYHARDMAVLRARLEDAPVVLASATPSLESEENARAGRYRRLRLAERYKRAALPEVSLIDLRRSPPPRGRWLAAALESTLRTALDVGEQALLFLNRRGYAPLTLCRACGHRIECRQCSAWLVEHRLAGRLQCHHCGYAGPPPAECPACGAEESLAACGPGVERIAEEAAELFPEARLGVFSSDSVRGPRAAAEFVARVEARDIDLIIGTQLAAKGHHFPWLTVVGVVDGDLGLAGGDLRASERTHQLLTQVAGRAGRAARPGRVLVQTWQPGNPVMQALASGNREAFLAAEREGRRAAGMPPYGRLAALVLASRDAAAVEAAAGALARAAPAGGEADVLGPAPAPLSLLRGRHRWRLLLKAPRDRPVQPALRAWLGSVRLPANVSLQIDVDPYSFM